jgi:cytochrome c oxidase subunit 2
MYNYTLCLAKNFQLGFQMPATSVMEGIINLHHHIMTFLVMILIFVGWMLFRTVYLFHHTRNKEPFLFNHSVFLETVWTLIPCAILVSIAIPSFSLIYTLDEITQPEVSYKVIGHQWYWSYEGSNVFTGSSHSFDSYALSENDLTKHDFRLLSVDNVLYLPVDTPIALYITSADVIHSWAVPSLGVKMDAIPGRLNRIFLNIKYLGVFYGQCSELCGVQHGFMPIVVHAINPFYFQLIMHYKDTFKDSFGLNDLFSNRNPHLDLLIEKSSKPIVMDDLHNVTK